MKTKKEIKSQISIEMATATHLSSSAPNAWSISSAFCIMLTAQWSEVQTTNGHWFTWWWRKKIEMCHVINA